MSSKKYGANFLKGVSKFRVPEDVTSKAIKEILQSLDCPRALAVWLLYESGEHEQLAGLGIVVDHYSDMVAFRDAYVATKLLSKYADLNLPFDPKEVAFEKFGHFELLCKQTNIRFRDLSLDPLFKGPAVWVHNASIRKIDKLLGEFDTEEFFSMPDWGPGATTLMKRRNSSPVAKFQLEAGITRDLQSLIPVELLASAYPRWGERLLENGCFRLQVGNKVITVPKDASTDRVIAVEPGINLWFQKSIGEMIRKRLLRGGIDLRWQSRNQKLAKLGSITNQLATVDLSSASDSIASSVVRELIPRRWYDVMDSCRSHFGVRSDGPVKWEKFSSMGNGFTFELETLIFYAVALSCCEYLHVDVSDVSVYGDDIIIPSTCFELFSRMMLFYGFVVNGKKSFSNSPFRESCGSHHYLGADCKPVYLRGRLSSVQSIYRLANAVRRLAKRHNANYGCDARFEKVFDHLVQSVPTGLRLRIPDALGDGGFISNFDEATPIQDRRSKDLDKRGFEGISVHSLVEVSKTYLDDRVGYLLAQLWAMPASTAEDLETPKEFSEIKTLLKLIFNRSHFGTLERQTLLKAVSSIASPRRSLEYNSVPLSGRVKLSLVSSRVQQWTDLGPWL